MSVVPGDIDTDSQPPMAIPLRHFVVGFAFLLTAAVVGAGEAFGLVSGMTRAGYRHLLLAGWVCLTIMGAMTQFVPVWSGVALHSRRLATAQLWATAAGVTALVVAFLSSLQWLFVPAGGLLVCGIWTFVYNLGRTLLAVDRPDVTEQHFLVALGWFALLTPLGFSLASGLGGWLQLPVARQQVLSAHVTVAVFGAVLTTVVGALYQLATMFTQTELHTVDVWLQRVERVTYPVGVALLAGGRLAGVAAVARFGGVFLCLGLFAVAVVVGRRLLETRVEWTPMLSRYAVLTVALAVWTVTTIPPWVDAPLARAHLLGAEASLLLVGVVGFVVLGTLYHVVPFIVWVHRYSDRLGFEQVPMIDDLYDSHLAVADLSLFVGGLGALSARGLVGMEWLGPVGRLCLLAGAVVFVTNLLAVLRHHGPDSIPAVVLGDAV